MDLSTFYARVHGLAGDAPDKPTAIIAVCERVKAAALGAYLNAPIYEQAQKYAAYVDVVPLCDEVSTIARQAADLIKAAEDDKKPKKDPDKKSEKSEKSEQGPPPADAQSAPLPQAPPPGDPNAVPADPNTAPPVPAPGAPVDAPAGGMMAPDPNAVAMAGQPVGPAPAGAVQHGPFAADPLTGQGAMFPPPTQVDATAQMLEVAINQGAAIGPGEIGQALEQAAQQDIGFQTSQIQEEIGMNVEMQTGRLLEMMPYSQQVRTGFQLQGANSPFGQQAWQPQMQNPQAEVADQPGGESWGQKLAAMCLRKEASRWDKLLPSRAKLIPGRPPVPGPAAGSRLATAVRKPRLPALSRGFSSVDPESAILLDRFNRMTPRATPRTLGEFLRTPMRGDW